MYFDYQYEKLSESIILIQQSDSLSSLVSDGLKPIISPNQSNFVYINYGKWTHHNVCELCPFIQVWKVRCLQVAKNEESRILKSISIINFPSLTQLVLNENNIESIEGINRIQMPVLQQLWLDNNFITSFGSIKKMSCLLKILSLNNNPIKDFNKIALILTEEIQQLSLQYLPQNAEIFSIFCIFKIRNRKLNQLDLNSKERIPLLIRMEEKFPLAQIYIFKRDNF